MSLKVEGWRPTRPREARRTLARISSICVFWTGLASTSVSQPVTAAETYYVRQDAQPGNACIAGDNSIRAAQKTIAAGLACLHGGDTLIVEAGVYQETMGIGTTDAHRISGTGWANPTRIVAKDRHSVVIKSGNQPGIVVAGEVKLNREDLPADHLLRTDPRFSDIVTDNPRNPRYIEFDGFVLEGQGIDDVGGGAIAVTHGAAHIRFKNGIVRGYLGDNNAFSCQAPGLEFRGFHSYPYNKNCEFINSEMTGNVTSVYHGGSSPQCFYWTGVGHLIEGSTIRDCAATAIRVSNGGSGDPNHPDTFRNNLVFENGIRQPPAIEGGTGIRVINRYAIVTNNIVHHNTINGITIGRSGIVSNNTVIGNGFYGIFYKGGDALGPAIRNNIVLGVEPSSINDIYVQSTIPGSNLNVTIARNVYCSLADEGHNTQYQDNLGCIQPAFVNPADGNFCLKEESPTTDAGSERGPFGADCTKVGVDAPGRQGAPSAPTKLIITKAP